MAKIFARIQRPSLRWGLIFGIILGVVDVVYNFAGSFITEANVQSILGYIPALLFLALGFYAGLRASQETGKWISGLEAGIWVAVIGTVILYVIPLVNTLINMQSIVASSQLYLKTHPVSGMKPSDYTASNVMITLLLELSISMISCAFCTVIGGALGGFMGRRRALALVVSANERYEDPLSELPVSDKGTEPAEEKEAEVEPVEVKDEAAP